MSKLRIARELDLPVDAVTQAIGILAKRRAGKSYTARRLAEQLYKAGQQIVIVDPKGDWWGIRSSSDGKSPGLPVVILGGERGDIPLEAGAGEFVAKLVVEERVSVLLDLSLFRKYEVATFMTAFLENLYRLKAREIYRTPLMLFVDEADAIAPQKPQENEARMLGAAEDIVRRGGQRGIGCTMITQRSAVLNKNVLTQVEVLVALRTIAPQDLKAIDAWIEVHGEKDERDMLMSTLPSLPVGDAWFWSPGWPTKDGIFQRVSVLPIDTFDSGATPKSGEKRVEPKNLADVDLVSLTKQMAATIERAKADDPKELRRTIASLNKEIAHLKKAPLAAKAEVDTSTIAQAAAAAVTDERHRVHEILAAAEHSMRTVSKGIEALKDLHEILRQPLVNIARELSNPPNVKTRTPVRAGVTSLQMSAAAQPREAARAVGSSVRPPNEGISGPQQRILNTLSTFRSLGIDRPSRSNVAVFSGASPRSSAYANNLGRLRTLGLIDYPGDGDVALTEEGRVSAYDDVDFSTRTELHQAWFSKLPAPQVRILEVLIDAHPHHVGREELAGAAGASSTSSAYANNLGALRSLGLIDYSRDRNVFATDLLFPEGLG